MRIPGDAPAAQIAPPAIPLGIMLAWFFPAGGRMSIFEEKKVRAGA